MNKLLLGVILIGILLYSPIVVGLLNLDNIYSNPFFRICEFGIGILLCSVWLDIKDKCWYRFFSQKWLLFLEVGLLVVGVTVAVMLHIPSEAYMMYSWIGIPIFTLMIFTFVA